MKISNDLETYKMLYLMRIEMFYVSESSMVYSLIGYV